MAKSIAQRLTALEKTVAQFLGLGPAKKKAKTKRKAARKTKAGSKTKSTRKKKTARRRRAGTALPFPPG